MATNIPHSFLPSLRWIENLCRCCGSYVAVVINIPYIDWTRQAVPKYITQTTEKHLMPMRVVTWPLKLTYEAVLKITMYNGNMVFSLIVVNSNTSQSHQRNIWHCQLILRVYSNKTKIWTDLSPGTEFTIFCSGVAILLMCNGTDTDLDTFGRRRMEKNEEWREYVTRDKFTVM